MKALRLLPLLLLGWQAAAPAKTAWEKICDKSGCAIQQQIFAAKSKNLILRVQFTQDKQADQARIQLAAPLGVLLDKGISLSIDGQKPVLMGYRLCLPDGCVAEAVISFGALATFLQAKTLTVRYAVSDQKSADIPVPLDGLDPALQSLSK